MMQRPFRTGGGCRAPSRASRLFVGLAVSAASACGGLTAEQKAAVARVQIVNVEPAVNCQNLGGVTGSRDSLGPRGVRAKAVILGGNTVSVDAHGSTTAFFCPGPAEARAAVPIVAP